MMTVAALLPYLPLSAIVVLLLGMGAVLYAAYASSRDAIVDGPAATKEDYAPVVLVTAAAIILYYVFLFYQSMTTFVEFNAARRAYQEKKTDVKPSIPRIKYGTENARVRVANRCAGNYQEQLLPFLVGLYLYATYVSVGGAIMLGWAWLAFRSYYMPVFKRGAPILFLSTIPAYCCVWWMVGGAVYEVSMKG